MFGSCVEFLKQRKVRERKINCYKVGDGIHKIRKGREGKILVATQFTGHNLHFIYAGHISCIIYQKHQIPKLHHSERFLFFSIYTDWKSK